MSFHEKVSISALYKIIRKIFNGIITGLFKDKLKGSFCLAVSFKYLLYDLLQSLNYIKSSRLSMSICVLFIML